MQSHFATKGDLTLALAEVKADILKWLFGILLTQTGLIAALVKLL